MVPTAPPIPSVNFVKMPRKEPDHSYERGNFMREEGANHEKKIIRKPSQKVETSITMQTFGEDPEEFSQVKFEF